MRCTPGTGMCQHAGMSMAALRVQRMHTSVLAWHNSKRGRNYQLSNQGLYLRGAARNGPQRRPSGEYAFSARGAAYGLRISSTTPSRGVGPSKRQQLRFVWPMEAVDGRGKVRAPLASSGGLPLEDASHACNEFTCIVSDTSCAIVQMTWLRVESYSFTVYSVYAACQLTLHTALISIPQPEWSMQHQKTHHTKLVSREE